METLRSGGEILYPATMMEGDERTVSSTIVLLTTRKSPLQFKSGDIIVFAQRERSSRPGEWIVLHNGQSFVFSYDELRKLHVDDVDA